jgi:hypothetical protein
LKYNRRVRVRFLIPVLLLAVAPVRKMPGQVEDPERLFATRVWPVLAEKCLPCHGGDPKLRAAGLDLTTRDATLRGGASGRAAVVPGKPEESALYLAVARKGGAVAAMPPKDTDRLAAGEVEWVRQWIAGGAPWPDPERLRRLAGTGAGDGITVATSGGLSPEWTTRRYKPENLWAYQPVRDVAPPAGASHPIDAFIQAGLARLGLEPAPPADRATLIRRATFDLIGLPPTPEEVAAFVRDPSPDAEAFGRVVERLLASPHYGEQWGRHWLDVVRYADSSGLANDYERPNAWRYRDYVIHSFNQDKPYDRFIREQIAGDEIDPSSPELLVATGFMRMGPWELTGMEVAKVARQRFLDDVTDAVGQVFLSHPLQCARCHDHKFDPIPTRDYYALQSVFATTQLAERDAAFLPWENTGGFGERKYLEERIARYEALLKQITSKEEAAARKWAEERGVEYIPRQEGVRKGIAEDRLPPRHIGLGVEDLGMDRIARKNLTRHRWELDRYRPIAFSVYGGGTPELRNVDTRMKMPSDPERAGKLETTAILAGGDPFSPTVKVEPGVLSCAAQARGASIPATQSGRRRALADWIASPENPLTARSLVNRVWQHHFGQGIAGTPNNFGATGRKPTHPELLDWLAAAFVKKGWSIKELHRVILSSEAYRRSSAHPNPQLLAEKDPAGASYAAFRPRRLEAEELRDAMLAVSGELSRNLGGVPARPEINLEAALQPREIMGTYAPAYQPSPRPAERHRRSIYGLRLRGLANPLLEVFNQPGSDLSCERRESSTVTPQVFTLFNGEDSYRRALAFAARLLAEVPSRRAVIERAFALAYGREPARAEVHACLIHWDAMTERQRALNLTKRVYPSQVVREAVDENTGERFKFTEILEVYRDFVPDLEPAAATPNLRALADVCLVLFNANEFVYVY